MRHKHLTFIFLQPDFDLEAELRNPDSHLAGADRAALPQHVTLLWWPSRPKPNDVIRTLFPEAPDLADDLATQSCSAALLFQRGARWVAIPLGHGHHRIRPYADRRYGLQGWRSKFLPGGLRQVRRRKVAGARMSTNQRAAMPVDAFQVPIDHDEVVLMVEANIDSLGTAVVREDALRTKAAMSLAEILRLADAILARAEGDELVEPLSLSGLERVTPTTQAYLDQLLLANDGAVVEPCQMACWTVGDVELPVTLSQLGERLGVERVDALLRRTVKDENAEPCALVNHLVLAEQVWGGMLHVRMEGHWYAVPECAAKALETELEWITVDSPTEWQHISASCEAQWSELAGRARAALVLDRELLRLPSLRHGVEVADLADRDHGLVAVKRYSGSTSATTHVAAQVMGLCRLPPAAVEEFVEAHGGSARAGVVTVVVLDERAMPGKALPYLLANAIAAARRHLASFGYDLRLMCIPWQRSEAESAA